MYLSSFYRLVTTSTASDTILKLTLITYTPPPRLHKDDVGGITIIVSRRRNGKAVGLNRMSIWKVGSLEPFSVGGYELGCSSGC